MKYFSYINSFGLLLAYFLLPTAYCFSQNRQQKVNSIQSALKNHSSDTIKVNLLNNLSTQLYEMDSYDSALIYAFDAKKLSEQLNFKSGLAYSYRRIGSIQTEQGNYPKALENYFKALKFESPKNSHALCMINNGMGNIYYFQNDYDKALEYYFKAYSYNSKDGLTCSNIGLVYIEKENYQLAFTYLFQALYIYKLSSDKTGTSNSIANIGFVYELEEDYETALEYYFKSLKIKQEINDKQGIANQLGGIGDVYFQQKKYKEALKYELQSLELAKQIGYISSIKTTSKIISDIYFKLNNCAKAFEHYKQFTIAKDSMFNAETTKKITGAEKDFEYQKKEEHIKAEQDKKDILTAQEKKRQRIIIYSVSSGLFLILLLALFIFIGYKQKKKDNLEISEQKKLVDEKNKDILDSIRYASRIQQAILPPIDFVEEIFTEHFIYFEPRDIVSGDFYFADKIDDRLFWATADCTGHSVNGSMLSMLAGNILSDTIKRGEIIPSNILDKLNERFNESLHKINDNSVRDGLDITLCSLDKSTMTLNFSGANNPLWLIRNGEIIEYKTDKMPIGQIDKKESYTNYEIKLQPNDCIYSFSDGICDLHSEENKKFMKKRLRELLLSVQNNSMPEQKQIITKTLKQWKGNTEQTDDMLLMGIKI